jgi:hypothetical protein
MFIKALKDFLSEQCINKISQSYEVLLPVKPDGIENGIIYVLCQYKKGLPRK